MGQHDAKNAQTLTHIKQQGSPREKFRSFVKAACAAARELVQAGKPVAEQLKAIDKLEAESVHVANEFAE